MNLRVIIVDDEPLAREGVRSFLAEETEVEMVAECDNGEDAVKAIEELRPDVVLLDVQMPGLNGFEVLEALAPEAMPAVIFTTAYDQNALRAFEVNAVDYLLKPYKQDRFREALRRARGERLARQSASPNPPVNALLDYLRRDRKGAPRILVKSPGRILFLKPEELDYIEASGNYVILHVGKEHHLIRETMSAMETRLAGHGFMRVSRSAIVNLSRVRALEPVAAGEYSLLLHGGTRLPMTCSLHELQERLAQV